MSILTQDELKVMQKNLRDSLRRHMNERGVTQRNIADLFKVREGTISKKFDGRVFKISEIDAISEALQLPEGTLYGQFVGDLIRNGKVLLDEARAFLVRCAETDRMDCIPPVVSLLLEESHDNLQVVFLVAEDLFEQGRRGEALFFYEQVIEHDEGLFHEELAISYFRAFQIKKGTDTQANWVNALKVELYRKFLPVNERLNALVQISGVYFMRDDWHSLERFADEMRVLAENFMSHPKKRAKAVMTTEIPLQEYIARGYVYKSISLEKRGEFEQAKQYIPKYAGYNDSFRKIAEGNELAIDIKSGNLERIPAYLDFLTKNKEEALAGIALITEACYKYGASARKLESVLQLIQIDIVEVSNPEISEVLHVRRLFNLFYFKAMILFREGSYPEAIDDLLDALRQAIRLNGDESFRECVTLFEEHRKHTSARQQETFKNILKQRSVLS